MEPQTRTVSLTEPNARIRIKHAPTVSRGWEYESTVELTVPLDITDEDITELMRFFLMEARVEGAKERDARNKDDGRA